MSRFFYALNFISGLFSVHQVFTTNSPVEGVKRRLFDESGKNSALFAKHGLYLSLFNKADLDVTL